MLEYPTIAKSFHNRYDVTVAAICKAGGCFDYEFCIWRFPDGSAGAFTDLKDGACEQYRHGKAALRFVAFVEQESRHDA